MKLSTALHVGSCATMLLGALPRAAAAQVVQGTLSVGGGVATDQRGISSNAVTLAPSLAYSPDPRLTLGAGLTGTQFQGAARALGGTATLGARLPLGSSLAAAASAAGSLTRTSFDATYAGAELTPTLEATLARLTLYAGAHLAQGSTTVGGAGQLPGTVLAPPAGRAQAVTTTRSSAGPVFGGVLNMPGATPDMGGVLGYREERARVRGATVTDRVTTGALAWGALALAASGGRRVSAAETLNFGSVSATLALNEQVALQGAAGTYPSNVVTGTFGGRFASVGVVLHAARRLASAEVPRRIAGAPPVPAGATRLVLAAPSARRVELAGDWNGWKTAPATRAADGSWYADVRLARGEYRYAFRVDGERWVVPDRVATVEDGYGGRSALLSVR